jgi:NAD-dependent SIR2 family protein deacetylase
MTTPIDTAGPAKGQEDALLRAAERIARADALLITAGAGMGVDSGLPDFRGTEGFWRAYPALARAGVRFEEIASPSNFSLHPKIAWGFYGHRLNLYRKTSPHGGFAVLKAWAERMAAGAFVLTSNVDGQFQKAGFDKARVCEIHGSIHHLQCSAPCGPDTWSARHFRPEIDEEHCRLTSPLPRCRYCGEVARPNILMFSDADWSAVRTEAQEAALDGWLEGAGKVAIVECGAGTQIPSVRRFGEHLARERHLSLVRINLREPHIDADGIGIALGAADALAQIDSILSAQDSNPSNPAKATP